MFTAALFTVAKTWKEPKCPSRDEWIKKMWYIYITYICIFMYNIYITYIYNIPSYIYDGILLLSHKKE